MTTKNYIKILIVGDFLILRSGLRMLLESEKKFQVIGETTGLKEALTFTEKNLPDILIVDSNEIDKNDFGRFVIDSGDVPVLVLTNSKDSDLQRTYLLLGANGIVFKDQHSGILFRAIERVIAGDFWFDRYLMTQTIRKLVEEIKSIPQKSKMDECTFLTEREKEILSFVCQGLRNKDIADKLFITETTVRHHLTSVFEKLRVKSRLELVVYLFNKGIVEIPAKISGTNGN